MTQPEKAADISDEVNRVLGGQAWTRAVAAFVLPLMKQYDLKSVVEFGCGTGHFAKALPPEIQYIGVDSSGWNIRKAVERNPQRSFVGCTVENFALVDECDLGCAFDFMRLFPLQDWNEILMKVLSKARYGAVSFRILGRDVDLREPGFVHACTFVTEETLATLLDDVDHREQGRTILREWVLPRTGELAKEVLLWTVRAEYEKKGA